jgi:hypothetical protein
MEKEKQTQLHTDIFKEITAIQDELLHILESTTEEALNIIPFEGSWTAAQLADHITKSNNGMARALAMKGIFTERDPEPGIESLKKMFLNFENKFNAPEFIVPGKDHYNKQEMINELRESMAYIKNEGSKADLSEIVDLPVLGTNSKLELLHFVLYHTQRHVQQLKKIKQFINN